MHKTCRHSIHVLECLSVTIETIEGIRQQQKAIYDILSSGLAKIYREQAQEHTRFQLQMVKSLKLRARSNYERLQNEIKLVIKSLTSFLLLTPVLDIKTDKRQAYNIINVRTTLNSSSMRVIAVLTALFLPFTFITVR
jgi:hypothetical protein